MKLTIEIPDTALRNAVESQIGIALSAITGEAVQKQAQEIIALKLGRFSLEDYVARTMRENIDRAVDKAIESSLGSGWTRSDNIKKLLREVIEKRVEESLKGGR